jgi:DNA-binding NtrC family response regulator
MAAIRILIVEDEETLCESLKRVLSREGYVVDVAYSAESAIDIFDEGFYDVIITDIILPGITGIELLKKIKEQLPEQIVIITTAYASLETAVEALKQAPRKSPVGELRKMLWMLISKMFFPNFIRGFLSRRNTPITLT